MHKIAVPSWYMGEVPVTKYLPTTTDAVHRASPPPDVYRGYLLCSESIYWAMPLRTMTRIAVPRPASMCRLKQKKGKKKKEMKR